MITKKDALNVGIAICDAVKGECRKHSSGSENVIVSRSTGIEALESLWYDVLPERVKADFNYDRGSFYRACGWE